MSLTSEFVDWKSHPMTKRVFDGLRERENEIKERLALSAGKEPDEDRFRVGYIAALRDVYLMDVESVEGTE